MLGATAEIQSVRAGVVVAAVGDSTVTIDLYKNGASILSAPIVLDNTNTAYTEETGTLSSDDLVQGDCLEVVVTVSAGTGTLPQGLYVEVDVHEDAA